MLRGIHQESISVTPYVNTQLTQEEKLARIRTSPVKCRLKTGNLGTTIDSRVPYSEESNFGVMNSTPDALLLYRIALGDPDMYGHGIGSRIMRATTRLAVERFSAEEVQIYKPNLGSTNLAISVFGEENVTLQMMTDRYGNGTDKPLEAVFDDYPFVEGETYVLRSLTAQIDTAAAVEWEAPQVIE